MKIIRPIDLAAEGAVSSNAPGDGFTEWEYLGRDNQFPGAIVTIANDTAYAANNSAGPSVEFFDLATSDKTGEFSGIAGGGTEIVGLSASPDGDYLAILVKFTSVSPAAYLAYIFDTATWQEVYSDLVSGGPTLRLTGWRQDSAALFYTKEDQSAKSLTSMAVEVANWVGAESGNILTGFSSYAQISSFYPFGKSSVDSAGNHYVSTRVFYSGALSATLLSKTPQSGASSDHHQVPYLANGVFVNDSRGEGGLYGGTSSPYFFALSNLSQVGAPSGLSGYNINSVSLSKDGLEIAVQSGSVQPYNRRFSSSDYSALTAFPATDYYQDVIYGANYVAFLRAAGSYDIVEIATNSLLEQTNPTVTAGDIYTYGDRNYEALEDNSDRPDLGAQLEVPTWLNLGAINPLRMFDAKLDSRTTAPSPLTITVTPGVITNGLALFNVSAASVQVVMDDPTDGVVYDSGAIQMLDNSAVNNWWDFFFAPYLEKADLALIDLLFYPDATLTITLSSDGGEVALGELVLGRVQNIGEAQYGTSVGIIDASTKERDVFGNFEIIERKFSKRAEFDVSVPTSSASGMQRILAQYRATPVVWVGNMGLEATIVYGFYRDFQINFSHYSLSDATITVEGL